MLHSNKKAREKMGAKRKEKKRKKKGRKGTNAPSSALQSLSLNIFLPLFCDSSGDKAPGVTIQLLLRASIPVFVALNVQAHLTASTRRSAG